MAARAHDKQQQCMQASKAHLLSHQPTDMAVILDNDGVALWSRAVLQ